MVLRALTLGPLVRWGWGAFSAHSVGDDPCRARTAARVDPVGTAGASADSPRRMPLARCPRQPSCPTATPRPAASALRATPPATVHDHDVRPATVRHVSAAV